MISGISEDDVESALNCFELQQRASRLVARRVLLGVVEKLTGLGFHDLSGLSVFSLNNFMVSDFKRSGYSRFEVLLGGPKARQEQHAHHVRLAERVAKGRPASNDNDPEMRGSRWKSFHPIRAASRGAPRGAAALQRAKEKRDG